MIEIARIGKNVNIGLRDDDSNEYVCDGDDHILCLSLYDHETLELYNKLGPIVAEIIDRRTNATIEEV